MSLTTKHTGLDSHTTPNAINVFDTFEIVLPLPSDYDETGFLTVRFLRRKTRAFCAHVTDG